MLDQNLKTQLQAYLGRLTSPVELVASLATTALSADADNVAKSVEMQALLADIASLSPLVSVRLDGTATRRPSFTVGAPGAAARITFAGLPMGPEFTSLVLALLQVGGYPPKVSAATIEQVRALNADLEFETYISLISMVHLPEV